MDQYRVVTPAGKEYGPVDLAGLVRWVKEGRITAATQIRKNADTPVAASTLPELAQMFAEPAAAPSSPPVVVTVPLPAEFKSWEFIDQAWQLVKPHWVPLSVMFLLMSLVGAVPYIGGCISFVIGGALLVGIYRAIFGALAGRPPTVDMMFNGFDRFGQAFVATLVCGLLIGLGTLLFIIPGIILAMMWLFTMPIIAETNLDFWGAMQASARLTEGYRWPLFCLCLASIPIMILGVLCLCVGIFPAQAVIFTAFVLAYRFLQSKKGAAA
ncbi:MAG TPA: hypothetical protein VEU08_03575 [Vicinamibacterales bacterium]|nr:hypothetical protein [Vicinamibacterales bacterium]